MKPIDPIILKPCSIARSLGALAGFLVLASIGFQLTKYLTGHTWIYGLVPLFFVDAEQNIPTFFSVLLLLAATLLLTVIALLKNQQRDAHRFAWAVLAFGFLCMAADEAIAFHERLVVPMRAILGHRPLGIFYFAWVIPALGVVLVLALCFLRFLWHLPVRTRSTFVAAAILFLGGALGFEMIGARYTELHGSQNLLYTMIATVEESLEMTGTIVFIYALLRYIDDTWKEVRFGFNEPRKIR